MSDLTTQILIEIREAIRETNASLSSRIDQTNERLDQSVERLGRLEKRQVATEARLATELSEVSSVIRQLNDSLIDDCRFSARIADHEARISRLEQQQG